MTERTLCIAEAGVNHNGSLDLALKLVDAAADAGADIVKFQTFKASELVTARAPKAEYQVTNTGDAGTQFAMLKQLELSPDQHRAVHSRCIERGIRFMSTAFDSASLAFLAAFDMPAIKIPSGDLTCARLLLQAARLRKPVILSTGMATMGEIEQALGVLAYGLSNDAEPANRADFERAYLSTEGRRTLERNVTLLHCVTQYPAPVESVNLRAMQAMATAFGLPVGYSDHTCGIEIAIAAVALGARAIEKHFTLDRTLPGPDHAASLEPGELRQMIQGIRAVERALGDGIKVPVAAEVPNRLVARRSVVAARPIRRGEVITADMLTTKRPADGVSPMDEWSLIGRPAPRDYERDERLDP